MHTLKHSQASPAGPCQLLKKMDSTRALCLFILLSDFYSVTKSPFALPFKREQTLTIAAMYFTHEIPIKMSTVSRKGGKVACLFRPRKPKVLPDRSILSRYWWCDAGYLFSNPFGCRHSSNRWRHERLVDEGVGVSQYIPLPHHHPGHSCSHKLRFILQQLVSPQAP